MANTAQARKRARQNDKNRLHNASRRSMMRTHIKAVLKAVEAGDKALAQSSYQSAVAVIDKSAKVGLLHKNKASRFKSRLNTRVRALA